MGFDYFVFYTEASIVCTVILLMMLINDRLHSAQQETQVCFNHAIISFIMYFISDAFWAATLSGQIPRVRILVEFFNLTNYIILSLMAYEWFMFMAASEKIAFRNTRKGKILCLMPMLVSTLFMVCAYAADPIFWINEENEVNSLYGIMLIAAPVLYLMAAFAISVANIQKTESKEEKQLYWLIATFPIGVIASGLIQMMFLNAPVFCFGCTIMLLFFYIQHMQTQISVDALTRMNNRGQINRYMEQVRYSEESGVYIMMIDIDGFKHINDTYGHVEGDRALVLVSKVLKKTGKLTKASIFLGRYGGDEFTLIIQNLGNAESPDEIISVIRNMLYEERKEEKLPYQLEISAGYAELRDENDTMKDCMIRADENLYKEKRAKGALR